jgi:hypothetical protein
MARSRTTSREDRRTRLDRALASADPLGEVAALVDESAAVGQVFKFAFACILETNSAELPILFDRFEGDDLRRVEQALETIEATKTLEDYRTLKRIFEAALASGVDPLDASGVVASRPEAAALGRRHKTHVAEMERQLVSFCRAHVGDL